MASLAQTVVNHHSHQAVSVNHFFPLKPTNLMTFPTISFKLLPPSHHFRLSYFRLYAAVSTPVSAPSDATQNGTKRVATATKRLKKKVATATIKRKEKFSSLNKKDVNNELKLNWANSLSGALLHNSNRSDAGNAEPGWVFGIDPDMSGALAVLKPDNSPQVFDTPHLKTLVGTTVRRRLDARLITQLLQTIDAPIGTTAYLEQSMPYRQDGNLSCWGGGFGYGLWIGILVASGYTVVPVPPMLWKNEFNLSACKDDSRELASTLFPSMSSLLLRKKDHGRAEALLIAAYGKGLKASCHTSCILEDDIPHNHDLQAPECCELEAALSFSSSSL